MALPRTSKDVLGGQIRQRIEERAANRTSVWHTEIANFPDYESRHNEVFSLAVDVRAAIVRARQAKNGLHGLTLNNGRNTASLSVLELTDGNFGNEEVAQLLLTEPFTAEKPNEIKLAYDEPAAWRLGVVARPATKRHHWPLGHRHTGDFSDGVLKIGEVDNPYQVPSRDEPWYKIDVEAHSISCLRLALDRRDEMHEAWQLNPEWHDNSKPGLLQTAHLLLAQAEVRQVELTHPLDTADPASLEHVSFILQQAKQQLAA